MDRRSLSPPAPPSATWRRRSLRASPRRRSPASVDGKLVDLTYPLHADAAVRIVTDKPRRRCTLYRHSTAHLLAAAVTHLFPGAQCGIGPATDEGFFYDFVVDRARSCRRISRPSRRRCGSWRPQDLPYERQMWPREEAKAFFDDARRAAEGAADRREDRRPDRGVRATRSRTRTRSSTSASARTCRPPASSRRSSCSSRRTRTGRATRRTSRCSASTARRSSRDKELKAHLTQIEEAKKRDHRKLGTRARPVHVPPVGAGRGVLARQGHDALQHARQLHARRAVPGRLRRGARRRSSTTRRCGRRSGHWQHYRQNMFLIESERRADGREGDELPRAHPRLRQRGAQLPRSAAPLSTSRRRCTATKRRACSRA